MRWPVLPWSYSGLLRPPTVLAYLLGFIMTTPKGGNEIGME
jgi:hypothetical protein